MSVPLWDSDGDSRGHSPCMKAPRRWKGGPVNWCDFSSTKKLFGESWQLPMCLPQYIRTDIKNWKAKKCVGLVKWNHNNQQLLGHLTTDTQGAPRHGIRNGGRVLTAGPSSSLTLKITQCSRRKFNECIAKTIQLLTCANCTHMDSFSRGPLSQAFIHSSILKASIFKTSIFHVSDSILLIFLSFTIFKFPYRLPLSMAFCTTVDGEEESDSLVRCMVSN